MCICVFAWVHNGAKQQPIAPTYRPSHVYQFTLLLPLQRSPLITIISPSRSLPVFSTSPQFTVQPSGAPIAYAQTATLACQAIGTPSPTITWWRGSLPVPTMAGKHSQLSDNSLQITDFSSIDEGEYACIAENSDGSVRSRNASITLACELYGTRVCC